MNLIRILFLLLYLFSGYVYNTIVIDKISFQWLYLSILNSISLIYFNFYDNYKKDEYNSFFKNNITILFLSFILIGLLTFYTAINKNEVIINFFRWINILAAFFIYYIILIKTSNPRLTLVRIISFGLFIELVVTFLQIFSISYDNVIDFNISQNILGLASNKNINAASIVTKLPFVFYIFLISKKEIERFYCVLIIFTSSVALNFIGSRASFVSIIFIIFFFTFVLLLEGYRNKNLIKSLRHNIIPILSSIILAFISTSLFLGKDNSSSFLNRVQTINIENQSTSLRITYYKQAIDQFINNPIIGVGLGNWKVKSIDYDNLNMINYTVQYHTHNDILQFMAELGIFGAFTYLAIFISSFLYCKKNLLSKNNIDSKFSLILILSLGSYFIDSNLNFPHARVINLIVFISILAGSLLQHKYVNHE